MRRFRLLLERQRLNEAAELLIEITRLRERAYALKDVLAVMYKEGVITEDELIEALRLLALPLSRVDSKRFTPVEEEVVVDPYEPVEDKFETVEHDVKAVEERYLGQDVAERLRL